MSVHASGQGLLITEIKLGGGGDPKEFVELFNDSDQTVNLEGLQVEYAKATFSAQNCQAANWKAVAGSGQVNSKTLNGTLAAYSFQVVEVSLNDNVAGSVHVVTSAATGGQQLDLVGWGETAPCYKNTRTAIPGSGKSISRTFDATGHPVNTQNNSQDFKLLDVPSAGLDECLVNDCYATIPTTESEADPAEFTYANLIYITELLPDPASPKTDAVDEFIELYNPQTFSVNLKNFVLHTGTEASTYRTTLGDIVLEPGTYKALYASETKVSLVNSKSGYAWLTASDGSLVYESDWYPEDIGADEAWAWFEDGWQITTIATPGEPNQISPVDVIADQVEDSVTLCPVGKYRNPDTNRCRNIEVVEAALATCKPGQVRNPETNRCRNATIASQTLTTCQPGQIRSPVTNRCRANSATVTATCQPGYERNSTTNRCRKVTAVKANTTTKKLEASMRKLNLLLVGSISCLIAGYAVYEYRQDLLLLYQKLKGRFNQSLRRV